MPSKKGRQYLLFTKTFSQMSGNQKFHSKFSCCFITGEEDIVRCFYCGGSLRNWDRTQNPFTKHAQWYPDCDYIRKVTGEVEGLI